MDHTSYQMDDEDSNGKKKNQEMDYMRENRETSKSNKGISSFIMDHQQFIA